MRSTPLVTVVIPAFNAEAFIGEAIASIQRQTIDDWQLIVVNDGARDQTLAAARQAAGDDPRIRIIHFDRNQGISVASNAGFDAAHGEFIARLDSDDRAAPTRLAAQVEAFRANDRLAVVGSHARVFGDVPDGDAYCFMGDTNLKAHLLDGPNTISGGTLMVRRSFVREHQVRFDEFTDSAEDLIYLTAVMAAGGQMDNVNQFLTEHRSHQGSFTNSRVEIARRCLQDARSSLLGLWYPRLDPRDIELIVATFIDLYAPSIDAFFATVRAIDRLIVEQGGRFGENTALVLRRFAKMATVYRDHWYLDASYVHAIRYFVSPAVSGVLDQLGL